MEKRVSPWSGYGLNTDKAVVQPNKPKVVAVIQNPLPHGYEAPGPLVPKKFDKKVSEPLDTEPIDHFPEKVAY